MNYIDNLDIDHSAPVFDNLAANSYRLEIDSFGPTLRLYRDGIRKNAFVRVEITPQKSPDDFLELNMPDDDRAELAGWFERRNNDKTK